MADNHHHHHGHSEHITDSAGKSKSTDFAAANKEHYTGAIADFDKPEWTQLARKATAAFQKIYDFDEESTTVMDFACGVGLISRELAPCTKSIVGVDITEALVEVYNDRVSNQGITPDEMRAVCVELKGEDGELDGLKFDVIVCSMSYHHFGSIEDITKVLAFFLKPGGALLVVDILEVKVEASGSSESFVSEKHRDIVAHAHGFKEEQIRAVFEGAGLTAFMLKTLTKGKINGRDTTLFVAKGLK